MTPTQWAREAERLALTLAEDEHHLDLLRWAEQFAIWGSFEYA
jgi:hypothetical protein